MSSLALMTRRVSGVDRLVKGTPAGSDDRGDVNGESGVKPNGTNMASCSRIEHVCVCVYF